MKQNQSSSYTLLLAPFAAATTVRTAQLDMAGADYASVVVVASAEANTNSTNVALTLAQSDGTNHTTITTTTLDNTSAAKYEFHVNPNGKARYLRLTITPDSSTNGAVITSAFGIEPMELQTSSGGSVTV